MQVYLSPDHGLPRVIISNRLSAILLNRNTRRSTGSQSGHIPHNRHRLFSHEGGQTNESYMDSDLKQNTALPPQSSAASAPDTPVAPDCHPAGPVIKKSKQSLSESLLSCRCGAPPTPPPPPQTHEEAGKPHNPHLLPQE
ncbi:uncharacterized protein LY89DRAFT_107789 [Mollisia scopiformis]|uniref:Uncharacterized protein n=1 Tax=Mollisia scopiformis TaxID=149040 RepID=A0A194X639_MOLSC|nr:uncharacterized protein LY89DRAFT_107789 [Mollisia scopiformis]KUJ15272.1 hypothetical protein LY89DRAFT_107789 [Mollisia scopiformis]